MDRIVGPRRNLRQSMRLRPLTDVGLAVFVWGVCASLAMPASAAPSAWRFEVTTDRALETVTATLCVENREKSSDKPVVLAPMMREARPNLRWARAPGTRRSLMIAEGEIQLGPTGCVVYQVALAEGELSRRVGADVTLAPDAFLWLSRPMPDNAKLSIHFVLPPGIRATVPWAGEVPDPSLFDEPSRMVLGTTEPVTIGPIEAVFLGGTRRPGTERWIERAQSAAATLAEPLPARVLAIIEVVKASPGSDPVVFGASLRGGGAAVELLLARNAKDEALAEEWVLVHELSHFALPLLAKGGSWLGEGLASYHQNVLRARGEMLTVREAWKRLNDGFARGRRDANCAGLTLAQASAKMHAKRCFHRVYWGGAAVVFLADVELRRRGSSLDEAIAGLPDLGPRPEAIVLARALGFETLAEEALGATVQLDVSHVFEALGVVIREGEVRIDPNAPDAGIARAIVSPLQRAPGERHR